MAKRLTDTDKWQKKWFRELGSKLRDLRQYMLDNCDHAGVIELDLATFAHYLGNKITIDDVEKAFRGQIQVSDDKLFIPAFIDFQYKCTFNELNPENKVHKSIIVRLNRLDFKPLGAFAQGAKDKDKEKDKELDKELDKDKEKGEKLKFDFDGVYRIYPLKKGKQKGLDKCKAQIKTNDDFNSLMVAVHRYSSECQKEGREARYIKHFDTFMGSWRDYSDDDVGQCSIIEQSRGPITFAQQRTENNKKTLLEIDRLTEGVTDDADF